MVHGGDSQEGLFGDKPPCYLQKPVNSLPICLFIKANDQIVLYLELATMKTFPSQILKRLPHKVKGSLNAAFLDLFGQDDYIRFAIIGHARTGSNFLSSGLKSLKCIVLHNEIFAAHNRTIGNDFDRIFASVFRKEMEHITAVGCKIFYYHLTDDEWTKFLSKKNFRIIHLVRQNRLRTIVSLDIAFQSGK